MLSSKTSVFVILVAIAAFFVPDVFSWVQGNNQSLVLGVIMFTMGLTLTTEDFKVLAKRPLDIFIGAAAQYLIMPFLAYGISTILRLPNEIAIGLILVGCCPGGVSSNIVIPIPWRCTVFRWNDYCIHALSPLMTPMMVLFWPEQGSVNAASMFISIVKSVLLPVCSVYTKYIVWRSLQRHRGSCLEFR
ncbi:MAG: bile acid:sodium symporter family protein [Blautia marasmi]